MKLSEILVHQQGPLKKEFSSQIKKIEFNLRSKRIRENFYY